MSVVLDCKDGTDDENSLKIQLTDDQTEPINSCYEAYQQYKDPLIYLEKCYDFCKHYSLTTANELIDGKLNKLEEIYNKLLSSNLKSTDRFFDVSEEFQYNTAIIKNEFFENQLNF